MVQTRKHSSALGHSVARYTQLQRQLDDLCLAPARLFEQAGRRRLVRHFRRGTSAFSVLNPTRGVIAWRLSE
jgi:hypothetical protein